EVRLRSAQRLGPMPALLETILALVAQESRREFHRPSGGVTLMHVQLAVKHAIRRIADVADDALEFARLGFAGRAPGDAKAAILTLEFDGLDNVAGMEFDVGVGARRDVVGPCSQTVALLERVVGNSLERLNSRAACQPGHPC